MKRSTSVILDQKSLEMCTEGLGSETGSCTTKSNDEFPLLPQKSEKKFRGQPEIGLTKKMSKGRSFPPPLSSISSLDCFQVRPHRAGGRLVIKAVNLSPCHTYFHAERCDGRLTLRFLKDCCPKFSNEGDEDDGKDEHEEALEGVEDFEGGEEEQEDDYYGDNDEDDGDRVYWGEDIEGKSGNAGVEIGMDKLRRPTRCMQAGGHRSCSLLNCDTLWVAS